MHQKHPAAAAAAGGKACGRLLQVSTGPAADAETQPGTAETGSSAHVLLQGGSHRDLERRSFQTGSDALQFKPIWKEEGQQQEPPQRG